MKISLLLKLTGMFYENRIFSYDLRQKFIYLNRATIADEICLTVNVEEGNFLSKMSLPKGLVSNLYILW